MVFCRIHHHMDVRVVALIVECSVPSQVLAVYFHLLTEHRPLRPQQLHPLLSGIIAQPRRVLSF